METFEVTLFRKQFPEFNDTVKYPTAMIQFWGNLASAQVVQAVWQDQWITGVSLYVAHEITIAALNQKASAVGGTPGTSGGIANNKTVGSATVGYDATTTTERDGGWWNRTTYGIQFLRLARIFGSGCIQL